MAFVFFPSMAEGQGNDQTQTPGAKGADIVETVISRLDASCIFPDDKLFMRRLSYVESYDGHDPNTFRPGYYGGIWQVTMNTFSYCYTQRAIGPLIY
jgi:hypothetical protein